MMTKCHVGSWVGAQNKKKDISEKLRKKKKKKCDYRMDLVNNNVSKSGP